MAMMAMTTSNSIKVNPPVGAVGKTRRRLVEFIFPVVDTILIANWTAPFVFVFKTRPQFQNFYFSRTPPAIQ
jgi:hypothetical protein